MAFKDNVGMTEELQVAMQECSPKQLVIRIDPGEATIEEVKDLLTRVNDLHVASGGSPLNFVVVE